MNPTPDLTQPPALGYFSKFRQIALILLGMILLSSVAWLLVKKFNKPEVSAAKVVSDRLEKLKNRRAADTQVLESYGWIDKTTGVAHIPVEKAVELTIAELQAKPVKRSTTAPVPATQAVDGAAAATAPAAAPTSPAATPPTAPATPQVK